VHPGDKSPNIVQPGRVADDPKRHEDSRAKPSLKIRKLSDGNGLQLWVTPAGGKHWKLAYRHGQPAKQKLLPLGAYPAVGLADARRVSLAARELLAKGVDPVEQKKAERASQARAGVWTFEVIAEELVAKKIREGKSERTAKKLRWLFELGRPFIGNRPIASITAPQVLAALQSVESNGRLETAARLAPCFVSRLQPDGLRTTQHLRSAALSLRRRSDIGRQSRTLRRSEHYSAR
jgi:Arm DNA-binding domain